MSPNKERFQPPKLWKAIAEEKTVLVTLQFEPAAVDDEIYPLLETEIDIGAHLREMLAGDERPHFRLGVGARADLQRAYARHQPSTNLSPTPT
jgi:hypothetical protein